MPRSTAWFPVGDGGEDEDDEEAVARGFEESLPFFWSENEDEDEDEDEAGNEDSKETETSSFEARRVLLLPAEDDIERKRDFLLEMLLMSVYGDQHK